MTQLLFIGFVGLKLSVVDLTPIAVRKTELTIVVYVFLDSPVLEKSVLVKIKILKFDKFEEVELFVELFVMVKAVATLLVVFEQTVVVTSAAAASGMVAG